MSSNIGVDDYNKHKFVCYFCNKEIEGETEVGHNTVCSSVLVPCPNKCGVYISRGNVLAHNQICPTKVKRSSQENMNKYLLPITKYTPNLPSTMGSHQSYQSPSSTLIPNKSASIEFKQLQNRCSILEQYLTNLTLSTRNKAILDGQELEKLALQNRLFEEWRDIINLKLENLRQQLVQEELTKSEAKENWNKIRQYLLVFEKFKIDVSKLKETFSEEQDKSKQKNAEINQELNSVKKFFSGQISSLKNSLDEHNGLIERIDVSLVELKKSFDEHCAKFVALNFDVKALTRIATEATEKLEMQQRDFEILQKDFSQMKIDLEILEELPENAAIPTGRLLWKVANVESRMKRARENGIVLQSQFFYTHEFGYKVKVHLYLNGLNKWKDRYCLICLHVLKGEYDMTLKWPCNIEGSVTLRDLENVENPKNVTKTISAKRNAPEDSTEDPQESSSTYIFIPHGTLMKSPYLRDQTLFLDIRIARNKNLAQETNL